MDPHETLFSLELAVESLRINSSTVACRLPSVAFRLLDFPTLLLHHVDPEEAQNVKEKIIMDRFGEIPSQLQELKDHRGNFCINKCKSSLFKMSPKMLLAYLRNTPLYIMLVDVWPKVPKLVANCTIPLQRTMEEISHDIEQNGADIPTVRGSRDSYRLYNLMGSEVGWIVVRYRLLSMGSSLIPHIPQSAITKRGNESIAVAVTPRKNKDVASSETATAKQETDVVLEDLEVEGNPKTMSVATATIDHDFKKLQHSEQKQQATQTIQTSNMSTGKSGRKQEFRGSIPFKRNDDLIVNNTHCPPPLFFNTANEDVPGSSEQNLWHVRRGQQEIQPCTKVKTKEPKPTHDDDLSDELSALSSQTRSEDLVHQTETHYTFPSGEESASPNWSVRKTHRTLGMENSHVEKMEKQRLAREGKREADLSQKPFEESDHVCNRCQLQLDPHRQTQLPILEALLQELSLLHGNALQNRPTFTSSRTPVQDPKPHASTKLLSAQKAPLATPDEKENIRMTPPEVLHVHEAMPNRQKRRECAKPPQGVPPTKGWLRQQQPVHKGKHRTKLHYGMTNSQKLRLRKNNPELLKEMEMRESRMRALREEKERAMMRQTRRARDEEGFIGTVSERNISTEIGQHSDGEEQPVFSRHQGVDIPSLAGDGPLSAFKKKNSRQKDSEHSTGRCSETLTQEQSPVAAPRRPNGATFVWGDAGLYSEAEARNDQKSTDAEMQVARGTDISDYGHSRGWRESRGSVEHKDVSSSEKSARSIDVYLPSVSHNDSVSESNTDDSTDTDSQFSSASSFAKRPKTIRVPGLPSDQEVSREGLVQSGDQSDVEYSDDFVGSDNLASTGEQELAPLASNHSDSYHSAQSDLSDGSRSSSVRTTRSRTSQIAVPTPAASALKADGKPSNPQTRRLSIPKPKLSSISPVPVRRTSKTSTVSINTAGVTPDPLKDIERSPTPPTPKPRPSLLWSASSFSETSLLQSTVPSSEFKTEDSLNAGERTNQEESAHSYSDDFNNSEASSDHGDMF